MKKVLLSFAVFFSFLAMGFAYNEAEQKYKVENTRDVWQQKINILESAKQAIKNSNIPTNVGVTLMDSLSAFEQDIINQIVPQLPKPKADSTNKK